MFWIFAAVVLILCVGSPAFRKIFLCCAGFVVFFGFLVINEDVKKNEAARARQAAAHEADPAPKPTLDELLAD
jgi:hypothetical protein